MENRNKPIYAACILSLLSCLALAASGYGTGYNVFTSGFQQMSKLHQRLILCGVLAVVYVFILINTGLINLLINIKNGAIYSKNMKIFAVFATISVLNNNIRPLIIWSLEVGFPIATFTAIHLLLTALSGYFVYQKSAH